MTDRGSRSAVIRPLAIGAFLLGFALSGFFDGILLHQILRWHHLLSALDGDLRFQVAADGWFHVLMYVIAGVGLWRLYKARKHLSELGAGRTVVAWGLIGFGLWHVVDAVGSHWLLAIHRIRMDAENPLLWDVGWLALFGLVPLLWGLKLRSGGEGGTGGRTVATLLAGITVLGAVGANRPSAGSEGLTTIAFAPWVSDADAVRASLAASQTLVWSNGNGVVVVSDISPAALPSLFKRGAMFVGGAGLPQGCLAYRG